MMGSIEHFDLKARSDLHIARKIWHATGISIMVLVHATQPIEVSWLALGLFALLIVPGDVIRQYNSKVNFWAHKLFGPVMRKSESKRISGSSFLVLGAALNLLFFESDIINISLLFLAFGDPIASYFGIRFGREKLANGKTLQGFLAALVVCSIIVGVYCYSTNILVDRLWIVIPIGGIIGALSELITIKNLDDNLSFPVLSSLGLSLMFYLFS